MATQNDMQKWKHKTKHNPETKTQKAQNDTNRNHHTKQERDNNIKHMQN